MKKKAIAIAVLLSGFISSVQATPQKNSWYLGGKIGSMHPYSSHYKSDQNVINDIKLKKNIATTSADFFMGYQMNSYLGAEVGYKGTGYFAHRLQEPKKQFQIKHFQVSTKLSYPIKDNVNIYTRLGGNLFVHSFSSERTLKTFLKNKSKFAPMVALGLEYEINKNVSARIDYEWEKNVSNIINTGYAPTYGSVNVGFIWKLPKSQSDHTKLLSHDISQIEQNVVFKKNISFPSGKAELVSEKNDTLDQLNNTLKKVNLNNLIVTITSHSDQIGADSYNRKLSHDRIQSIVNYLIAKGITEDKITIKENINKKQSMTQDICKNIHDKSLLVDCLALDRNIEVKIQLN